MSETARRRFKIDDLGLRARVVAHRDLYKRNAIEIERLQREVMESSTNVLLDAMLLSGVPAEHAAHAMIDADYLEDFGLLFLCVNHMPVDMPEPPKTPDRPPPKRQLN